MNDLNACVKFFKDKKEFRMNDQSKTLFYNRRRWHPIFLLQIQFFRHHVKVDKVHSDGKQYRNYKGYIHAW